MTGTVGKLAAVLMWITVVQAVTPVIFVDPSHEPLRTGLSRIVTLANRTNCDVGDTAPPNRVDTDQRVQDLMDVLATEGYAAYIIPTGDEHQSEYAPLTDLRRSFITGFDGSAGTAVVLANGVRALWTDSRYFLQADDQLDCQWLFMKQGQAGVPSMVEFLKAQLNAGDVVAADAKLSGYGDWLATASGLAEDDIGYTPSSTNLVDEVWDSQPPYGTDSAFVHPIEYAGRTVEQKLTDVRTVLTENSADALVITALDEVAWLYNIRGRDVPFNPVVRSYAIVTATDATLYINEVQTTNVTGHLSTSGVTVQPYEDFFTDLGVMSADSTVSRIFLPDNALSPGCSYEVYTTVTSDTKRFLDTTPTLLNKAEKNSVEITQMKEAHIRDATALIDFIAYLDSEVTAGRNFTEVSAQRMLDNYRAEQEDFIEPSFGTISGYGEHGAIVHYEATEETDVAIGTDSLYLLDSGGQYFGATTDVTRTLHFGTPTNEMIDRYTRVLQGTIDYASLIFPAGTTKTEIDILARRYLHMDGLDYGHGTSHGIGMCLNVHEPVTNRLTLGNVASDEPGYYLDGSWGIRIENQVVVVETEFVGPYYGFETMTLVPMEPKLIDVNVLTDDQIDWLNAYNTEIRDTVGPELQAQGLTEGYDWMISKTAAVARPQNDSDGAAALCPLAAALLVTLALALV